MRVIDALSTQMGAVRLHRAHPIESAEAFDQTVQIAVGILDCNASRLREMKKPERWVGVGGTFTSLGAMEMQLDTFDRTRVEGCPLAREAVRGWGRRLSVMPWEERLRLPGLQPQRADIVAHGIAILLGCMTYFGIDTIAVSDKGNMDGYLRKKLLKKG